MKELLRFLHALATTASWFTVFFWGICFLKAMFPNTENDKNAGVEGMVYLLVPGVIATAWLVYAGGGF